MPEVRECFIHYTHTHYVLVDKLGLGTHNGQDWTLRALWADATQDEAGHGRKKTGKKRIAAGLTDYHAMGHVDKITANCNFARGQMSNQTNLWPPSLQSTDGSEEYALNALKSLVLEGISFTPRSLILKLRGLDLQVSPVSSFVQ